MNAMRLFVFFCLPIILFLYGCMGTGDVLKRDESTYYVSSKYGSINGSWERATREASKKGHDFCSGQRKKFIFLSEQREGVWGFSPQSSTITFRCEEADDSAKRAQSGSVDEGKLVEKSKAMGSVATNAPLKTPPSFEDELLANVSPAKNIATSKIFVVSIGIETYSDVADVPFAKATAEVFATLFLKLGVQNENILLLTNSDATSGRLRGRLKTFLNRLEKSDTLYIYFAGHGLPSKDGRSSYLLAQDGGPGGFEEPELELTGLYDQITKSRVGSAIVFIDACFSGRTSKSSLLFEGVAPISIARTKEFDPGKKIAVLTAGKGDQFANQLQRKKHRLFGYYVIKSIASSKGPLTLKAIFPSIKESVLRESRSLGFEFEQEPELLGNPSLPLIE